MQQHGSNYFARRPHPLDMGSVCQNSTFSEHGNVAYQIKENHEFSNMIANILRTDAPPPDPGDGVYRSKFKFFRTWSCCISN